MEWKEKHFKLSDAEFLDRLHSGTLDPIIFTHEAHLRLAWIFLRNSSVEKACDQVVEVLRNYILALGETNKFNLTLTIVAVRIVHHFMGITKTTDFAGFIHEFPQLKTQFKELIAQHYSHDLFLNQKAKDEYLEPDLQPF